jgi:hypothetical protein
LLIYIKAIFNLETISDFSDIFNKEWNNTFCCICLCLRTGCLKSLEVLLSTSTRFKHSNQVVSLWVPSGLGVSLHCYGFVILFLLFSDMKGLKTDSLQEIIMTTVVLSLAILLLNSRSSLAAPIEKRSQHLPIHLFVSILIKHCFQMHFQLQ